MVHFGGSHNFRGVKILFRRVKLFVCPQLFKKFSIFKIILSFLLLFSWKLEQQRMEVTWSISQMTESKKFDEAHHSELPFSFHENFILKKSHFFFFFPIVIHNLQNFKREKLHVFSTRNQKKDHLFESLFFKRWKKTILVNFWIAMSTFLDELRN